MIKIGYRTIKTAIGAGLAIYIAELLQLENTISAGILAILCIKATKKGSLYSSWVRFLACLIGIAFSIVLFEGIGYHPLTVALLLLLFIPTTVKVKLTEGIVSSSVIILHFYHAEQFTWNLLFNELAIITIGMGIALLMNLYMPSLENELLHYQREVEENFATIFEEISVYLREGDSDWRGEEITLTSEILVKAKRLAFRDVENHITRNDNDFYHYFKMREKQFEIIERMLPIVSSLTNQVEQGKMIASFIEDLSTHIHPGNTAHVFLEKLFRMKDEFGNMELPKTREEFEIRAALFYFVNEMEQYLHIKDQFKEKD
jgi:uncharacterized membrane protein YgaE (UPF0421/DUF939 family)